MICLVFHIFGHIFSTYISNVFLTVEKLSSVPYFLLYDYRFVKLIFLSSFSIDVTIIFLVYSPIYVIVCVFSFITPNLLLFAEITVMSVDDFRACRVFHIFGCIFSTYISNVFLSVEKLSSVPYSLSYDYRLL